jgi:RNA polymerase sigma-70 factor (ECF subfamily)
VLAYCARRIGRTEAEDAAADVFAVAWRRVDDVEWSTVRPWLFGIARGVLANRWRAGGRRTRLLTRISGQARVLRESPEVRVVQLAQDEEVLAAVKRLRPADQEILLLAAWEEMTAPEIAAALDISVSAAEQRLHRAKRRHARTLRAARTVPKPSLRAVDERGH